MLGRLFQRLQHRVECGSGEHVDFIDHVDLEARIGRRVNRLLQQLRHFVHAAVGSGIHLDVIDEAPGIDRGAGFAHAAGLGGDVAAAVGADAIERFGENPRQRGLAHAARTGKQIRVMQAFLLQRMGQCAHHMLLTD